MIDDANDLTQTQYDDEQYEAWAAAHADQIYNDAFEAWRDDRLADGEPASHADYVEYLEGFDN